MSRVIIISGTAGERRIDYSVLTLGEIDKRLGAYHKQYGSFRKFFRGYDCESSSPEAYVTLVDWESLLSEQKARRRNPERSSPNARKKQEKAK